MIKAHYYQLAALIYDQLEKEHNSQKTTPDLHVHLTTFLTPTAESLIGMDIINKVAAMMKGDGAPLVQYGDQWTLEEPFDATRFNDFARSTFDHMFDELMITLDDPSQVSLEKFHPFTVQEHSEVILEEDYLTELVQRHRELLV